MPGEPVLVLGAGSWGTALGLVLARRGNTAWIWDCDRDHIESLKRNRCNQRHLPGIRFPDDLLPVADMKQVPAAIRDMVIAVPCEGLRDALRLLATGARAGLRLCVASKGLEPESCALNHEIVREVLGAVPVAVLSGPSFAAEVAAELPTAVTIASESAAAAARFATLLHGETFRVYTHDDIVGVQVGGAVKNVMAIAAGISDGLGFGANARAALITRGLAEIIRLGVAMGGRPETFMGLAGVGDLVLTCTDNQSRNRRFGLALAAGQDERQARDAIGQAVEGVRTAVAVCELARRHRVEMPICEQVHAVIRREIAPRDAVQALLARERKAELGG